MVGDGLRVIERPLGSCSRELRRLAVRPKAPHILSSRLNRFAGFLRARGIEIEWEKSGTRKIKITKRRVRSARWIVFIAL